MSSCVCVEQRQLNVAVRSFNISCLFLSTVPHSPHLAKVVSLCLAFEVIAVESGFSSGSLCVTPPRSLFQIPTTKYRPPPPLTFVCVCMCNVKIQATIDRFRLVGMEWSGVGEDGDECECGLAYYLHDYFVIIYYWRIVCEVWIRNSCEIILLTGDSGSFDKTKKKKTRKKICFAFPL